MVSDPGELRKRCYCEQEDTTRYHEGTVWCPLLNYPSDHNRHSAPGSLWQDVVVDPQVVAYGGVVYTSPTPTWWPRKALPGGEPPHDPETFPRLV